MTWIVDASKCRRRVIDLYGERGQAWLAELPALVAAYAARWSLVEVLSPFPNESYSFVAPARRADGSDCVLKIGVPSLELRCQVDILRLCDGQGMARLYAAEREQGALLMERLRPGLPLDSLGSDERSTAIAAQVMRQLWRPAPAQHEFQTVTGWAADLGKLRAAFGGGTGPFPVDLVAKAEGLFRDLLAGGSPPMLIHGDMNPGNILLARRDGLADAWLTIDPKGVVGDPLYDVATYLNNLDEWAPAAEVRAVLARRAAQFAEVLGVERERILAWGQAHAVLAGWWQWEDHNGREWEGIIRVAELYNGL